MIFLDILIDRKLMFETIWYKYYFHLLIHFYILDLEKNEARFNQSAKEFEQTKAYDKIISQLKKTIDESANLIEKPKRESEASKITHNTYNYSDTWNLVNMYVNLSQRSSSSRPTHYPRVPPSI